MTERLQSPEQPHLNETELMALGELCAATAQLDLDSVVSQHQELHMNPNDASGSSMFSQGDIPAREGFAYRQVGTEAIQDLAESGIVRNGATARGVEHARWGHRVFWSRGKEGTAVNTGGRFVIEAPVEAVDSGWVTADKVTAIHTTMPSGEVKDILPKAP